MLDTYLLQEKNAKVHTLYKDDRSEDLFTQNNLLTISELHVYNVLNFVLRSENQRHSELVLNDMFSFETSARTTRRSMNKTTTSPFCKRNLEKYSLRIRGARLKVS